MQRLLGSDNLVFPKWTDFEALRPTPDQYKERWERSERLVSPPEADVTWRL